jgi:hypothetical protein
MTDSFEERYLDVLQNIEFAIVSVYKEHPNLADSNVDRALEGLIRVYNAEASKRTLPILKLSEIDQSLFERIQAMCDWRLGRGEAVETEAGEFKPEPKTVEEIVACLKRIRLSVKRWTTQGGRQGYLKFVSQYAR